MSFCGILPSFDHSIQNWKLAEDLALPKELQEVPYDDIISLLDAHFTPKRNGFGVRLKFHTATQQPCESHQQWAARLRGLSADCGFSNVEEALRDGLVIGLLVGPVRDKLFAQSTESLTLGKAVELADSVRCARAGAGVSATSSQPVDQLFNMTQRGNRKDSGRPNPENCAVCSRINHKSAHCRFAKFKCNKCNEKGHLRKMCKNVNHLKSKNDGGKNKQHFGAGDQILYKKFKSNNNYYWCRGTILKRLGKVMYIVKDNLSFSHVRKHKNQLVPYKGDTEIGERIHEPDYDVYDNIEPQDGNEKAECSKRVHAGEEMDDTHQPRDTTIVESGLGEANLSSQASSQSNNNTESNSQPVDPIVPEEPSTLSRHTSRLLRNMPSIDYKRFF